MSCVDDNKIAGCERMERAQHLVESVHQVVGYPVAFLLVPVLLATFAGKPGHRTAGWTYLVLMTFLYVSGTFLTLTRHDWGTWEFARNLSFNFFGYSLLFYGIRAAYLFHRREAGPPTALDYSLAVLLTVSVAALASVAVWKDTPMRVYTLLGIVLVVLEWRDIKAGFQPRSVLYNRHVRFVLGSFFYVLTVASLVHLNDELPRNGKWLWPAIIGMTAIYLMTNGRAALVRRRRAINRAALAAVGVVTVAFGAYAVSEFLFGPINMNMADASPGEAGVVTAVAPQ